MKMITITCPDDTPINETNILNLIEPGAGGHTLMFHHSEDTLSTTVVHSRLGVTITTTKEV